MTTTQEQPILAETTPVSVHRGKPLTPPRRRRGDLIFFRTTAAAGTLILVILAAVAAFLLQQAWPAVQASPAELAERIHWFDEDQTLLGYVGPLAFGTLLASAIALTIATPVAVGVALFTSHYAPRPLAQAFGYVVDLLAAIPSVVYGLWGALWLMPRLHPIYVWLSENLGFLPLFEGPVANPPRTILTAGIILAVMILPIITAVSREVFLQTPKLLEEAALALGATRWEMIRMVVLPFGRSGVVGAAMLGLGRALGETMAVAMVLSPGFSYSLFLLKPGQQQTTAANIALQFPEATPTGVSVLVFTGLVLFVITLVVNMLARWAVSRAVGGAS
ncbi:phosphate ABC transporter permease subunit PstC [Thermasporomyces composti]|jgi:phosphate transport system permease protein|uniref:Phosphate transport system permease protein n=1 Tax=Thermasporomyces composti TaxID=696763 RepID=A0A3D9VDA2_THECX|nr:phosphate ABC transporter permease subunit PstC [Thermasporomyces composti]REF36144.1 phosphate ABC transporter membrane protein 1 (PhoT family) [Thermasporomyces composti]